MLVHPIDLVLEPLRDSEADAHNDDVLAQARIQQSIGLAARAAVRRD